MKPFIPEVPEDLDRQHTVTLTEGQISTILYCMEGYVQGSDDYSEESEFGIDVNSVFETLEGVVDQYYDEQKQIAQSLYDSQVECYVDDEKVSCSTFKDDYADKVDSLVDKMVKFDLECG